MFRASCRKSRQVPDSYVVIDCDETFEGAADIPRYTEHMTKVHGLSIWNNTGIRTPAWLSAKPYTFKAPRAGLPPAGKRRDAYLAAVEPDTQQQEAAA